MRRHIAAGLSILALAAGVGWKLASHPVSSAGLQGVRLEQRSERSRPGPTTLAGIRIRLSGSDFNRELTNHEVPQISLAAE
jgi:hypothetical protein